MDGTTEVVANYTVAINASDPFALYGAQYQCICLHSFNSSNTMLSLGSQMLKFTCEYYLLSIMLTFRAQRLNIVLLE